MEMTRLNDSIEFEESVGLWKGKSQQLCFAEGGKLDSEDPWLTYTTDALQIGLNRHERIGTTRNAQVCKILTFTRAVFA